MKNKGVYIFLASFLFSCPLWWSFNALGQNLEDVISYEVITNDPGLLSARENQLRLRAQLAAIGPVLHKQAPEPELTAKAAISIDLGAREQTVFRKNIQERLPIASLSKLMTALVVLENYDLGEEVVVSEEAVTQEEDIGRFRPGEKLLIRDLLYSLLMESSNDAAFALSEVIGQEGFMDLCSLTAKRLGLNNTFFVNPTGLTIENKDGTIQQNYSTAEDLARLTIYLLQNQPFIWRVLGTSDFDLYRSDGTFHHHIKTTNELLNTVPFVIGGKTGWTEEAGGCFTLVNRGLGDNHFLVSVILGSADRFGEMEKIINWVDKAYR